MSSTHPIIIQSDLSVLLEVDSPLYEEARDGLAQFAELVKSPDHIHTYRVTSLSLWNAAAAGVSASEILDLLQRYSRYAIPENVRQEILDGIARYGLLKLEPHGDALALTSADPLVLDEILRYDTVHALLGARLDATPWP